MSTIQKRLERLRSRPKDYTYSEARSLLGALGFTEINKGKTSGSRVKFYREKDKEMINLHKPHPEDSMKAYAVDDLCSFLEKIGEL